MILNPLRSLIALLIAAHCCAPRVRAADEPPPAVSDLIQRAAESLSAGEPIVAIQILDDAARAEPANPWIWFLRGRAHHQLGEPYAAMECFDRALDQLASASSPDETLIERIRSERRVDERSVHRLSLRAGFAYDSNVSYRGGGVSEFVSGKRDYKGLAGVSWDFAPWVTRDDSLAIGARVAASWHTDVHEFDDQVYGGYARYVHRLDDAWRLEVQYDYDFDLLGRDAFLSNHSLNPRFAYQWPAAPGRTENGGSARSMRVAPSARLLETSFDYRLEVQDFLYPTRREFDRDAVTSTFGLDQSVRVRPFTGVEWDWDIAAGYHVGIVPTEGSEFDRVGQEFSLALLLPMNGLLLREQPASLRLSADWELDHYDNASFYDIRHRERRDLFTTLGLIFSQTLADNARDGEVILHAVFQWTDADSNLRDRELGAPFSYEKTLAGLQLEWRF